MHRKRILIVSIILLAVCISILFYAAVCIPNMQYRTALSLMDAGNYSDAIEIFSSLQHYKDSAEKISQCNQAILDDQYHSAIDLMKHKKYTEAIVIFESLSTYKDCEGKIRDCLAAITEEEYAAALSLMEENHFEEAYLSLIALDGYKDSNQMAEECKRREPNLALPGDIVYWGTYEQDNIPDSSKEDIAWIVLERTNDRLLLISQYALDCKQYNHKRDNVAWDTCSLREWLNGVFFKEAFSPEQQERIPTVSITTAPNPVYDKSSPGNPTDDRVFCLDIWQVVQYFPTDEARCCTPTPYAISQGSNTDENTGFCWWWTRTPGAYQHQAAIINLDGADNSHGPCVEVEFISVRPAIWIDLS